MQDEENEQKREGKTTPNLSLHEQMKNACVGENGHAFWVFTCPKSQNWFSPKMGFPQFEFPAHTPPIPMR